MINKIERVIMNLSSKYYFICALTIFCFSGIAQTKTDSAFKLSIGTLFQYDYAHLLADASNELQNKFSYTLNTNLDLGYYLGKKRKIGIALQPSIGVYKINFKARIPTTDFSNPADSMGNGNFYRDGVLLPKEYYDYSITYINSNIDLHLKFKLSKIEFSPFIGIGFFNLTKKNYPAMQIQSLQMGYGGGSKTTEEILAPNASFKRCNAGLLANFKITPKFSITSKVSFSVTKPSTGHNLNGEDLKFLETPLLFYMADEYYNAIRNRLSFGIGVNYSLFKK